MKRLLAATLGWMLGAGIFASAAPAQTLYYNNGTQLNTLDADTAAVTLISSYSPSSDERAMAMDPVSGTMYVSNQVGLSWNLHTVNLSTAAVTNLGAVSQGIRGMVFDSAGKLWAVTGNNSTNSHALVSINTGTLAVTPENTSLPTQRNKIAYNQLTDTLYILGYSISGSEWRLYSFSPSDPATLTQVTLSGDSLDTLSMNFPGFVFDPVNNRLITIQDMGGSAGSEIAFITTSGVVSTGSGSFTTGWALAFDQAATASEDEWMMY